MPPNPKRPFVLVPFRPIKSGLANKAKPPAKERCVFVLDPFWNSSPSYALAVAEINLGIICGCIPVVVPLFKELPAYLSFSSHSVWERYLAKARSRSIGSDGSDVEARKHDIATRRDGITVTHVTEVYKAPASESNPAPHCEKYFV